MMRVFPFALLFLPAVVLSQTVTFKSGSRQAHLIELFTSQGCSSCPPAERWLNAWSDHPDLWKKIVPVAFHVDYWDRLGWSDIYASSRFSSRQRNYQHSGNVNAVYTPGFVVNGVEWRGYYKGARLPATEAALGSIEAVLSDKSLSIAFTFVSEREAWLLPVELNVAVLGVGITTNVEAGENARRHLAQDFVVLSHIKQLSGDGQWRLKMPDYQRPEVSRYALAVWATQPVSREVIQATGGWLP